jgi:uncharacterized delta-60 repeat protein
LTRVALIAFIAAVAAPAALGVSPASAALGDLDPSFGGDGKVVRSFVGSHPNLDDVAEDVAVLRDRKVVVLLSVDRRDGFETAVARFRPDGRLDRTFGADGVSVIRRPGSAFPGGLDLGPGGRVVVSFAAVREKDETAFGVARLRRDGTPDSSFAGDGVRVAEFGPGLRNAYAEDVAIGQDGAIVLAGRLYNRAEQHHDFGVARFTPEGDPDATFSEDGLLATDFAGHDDDAHAVAVDSAGRIVVAGRGSPGEEGCGAFAFARYESDGDPDTSFSEDGLLLSPTGCSARDVAALPDGGLVAVGESPAGGPRNFRVARYSQNGEVEAGFAGDGVQTIDFAGRQDEAECLTLTEGRIVVAGSARSTKNGRDFGIAMLRLNGKPDLRFSEDGRRGIDLSGSPDEAHGVAVDRAGNIVAAGYARTARDVYHTALVRLQGRGG